MHFEYSASIPENVVICGMPSAPGFTMLEDIAASLGGLRGIVLEDSPRGHGVSPRPT